MRITALPMLFFAFFAVVGLQAQQIAGVNTSTQKLSVRYHHRCLLGAAAIEPWEPVPGRNV